MRDYLLFIDTETTGLPRDWNKPYSENGNWPHSVQVAWTIYTKEGEKLKVENHFINNDDFEIEDASKRIHGITREFLQKFGKDRKTVMSLLYNDLQKFEPMVVGHFMLLDFHMVGADFYRSGFDNPLEDLPTFCTMQATTKYMLRPHQKFLRLGDLYESLFNKPLDEQHDALVDAVATAKCFFKLLERGDIDDRTIEMQQLPKVRGELMDKKVGCVTLLLVLVIMSLILMYWL